MGAISIFWSNLKWRLKNPQMIAMSLVQPLLWLVLFTKLFGTMPVGTENGSSYSSFALAGIIILLILTGGGMSGIPNYNWKNIGMFLRIFISPTKRAFIILGDIIDSTFLTAIEVLVLLGVGRLMGVKIESGFAGIILILLIVILTNFYVSAFSYAISMIFSDENSFIALVNFLMMPLFFTSSALVPVDNIKGILRTLIAINPFTYSINAIRSLIIKDTIQWNLIGISVLICIVLSIIMFAFAMSKLKYYEK